MIHTQSVPWIYQIFCFVSVEMLFMHLRIFPLILIQLIGSCPNHAEIRLLRRFILSRSPFTIYTARGPRLVILRAVYRVSNVLASLIHRLYIASRQQQILAKKNKR